MDKSLLTDYFGSVRNIELLNISTFRPRGAETGRESGKGGDLASETPPVALHVPTKVGYTAVVSRWG